jgi:hypothetical protein
MRFFIRMRGQTYPGTPINPMDIGMTEERLRDQSAMLCGARIVYAGAEFVIMSDAVIRDKQRVLGILPIVAA